MPNAVTKTARYALLTTTVVAATLVTTAQPAHAARPAFELPFPCGQQWNGATYTNHGGPGNHYPLDLNQGSGYDDFGKPVAASAPGALHPRVESDGDHVMEIDHGGGWTTEYRHLNAFARTSGTVARGTIIGYVGNRGTSSPHLHYEQQYNGVAQHIYLHGSAITYSFVYNGPLYTSYNCGGGGTIRDVTSDGRSDLVAIHNTGALYRYSGNGNGTFGSGVVIGSGWGNFRQITAADLNNDGYADLLGVHTDGGLYRYIGRSDGKLASWGGRVGGGWSSFRLLTSGDVNGDGNTDLLAIHNTGALYRYSGNGNGTFDSGVNIWSRGWGSFRALNSADYNNDGRADLLAVHTDGGLYRYIGRSDGTLASWGGRVGGGWNNFRLINT